MVLFYHEAFHCLTEVAASLLEEYKKVKNNNGFTKIPDIYNIYYFKLAKYKLKREETDIEEPMADAFSYRKMKKTKNHFISFLYKFMRELPRPYNEFYEFIEELAFLKGLNELIKKMDKNCNYGEMLFKINPDIEHQYIPEYLVLT